MSEWQKIGEVFLHKDAYGQPLTEIGDVLEEAGYRLNIEPLSDKAYLEMKVNGDD